MASAYEETWVNGPQNTNFFVRYYDAGADSKATLVFVHGFSDHIARYEALLPKWVERGYSVLAWDQRGFGRTSLDAEHKSRSSSYGKTCNDDQFEDINFFLNYAREKPGKKDTKLFLYGQSMGGGLVLGFVTRSGQPGAKLLSGVISTSPALHLANPAPSWQRWIAGKASLVLPYLVIPAPVDPEALSHDQAVALAYSADKLVIAKGTIRGIGDMLNLGDNLVAHDYARWPAKLPVLLVHGSADRVTSFAATSKFHDSLVAEDKTFLPFEGAFHEVHNEPAVKESMIKQTIDWADSKLGSHSDIARL